MPEYKCKVCHAEFESKELLANIRCPACWEPGTERQVEYTDRPGSFTIGGKIEQLG